MFFTLEDMLSLINYTVYPAWYGLYTGNMIIPLCISLILLVTIAYKCSNFYIECTCMFNENLHMESQSLLCVFELSIFFYYSLSFPSFPSYFPSSRHCLLSVDHIRLLFLLLLCIYLKSIHLLAFQAIHLDECQKGSFK